MTRGYQVSTSLKIIVSAVLLIVLWVPMAVSDTMSPQINMNTVMEKKEPGVIKVQVLDDIEVSKVTLFYRKTGEVNYNSIDMKLKDNNVYYSELRKELGLGGSVEYYLVAQDTNGNESTVPGMSPAENPITASMDGSISVSADEIVLGSPEPGMVYDTGDQIVMVTFYRTGREIDFNTIRLRIDKVDRTREADFVGNTLIWEPRRLLSDGVHEIEVLARDIDGESVGPNVWTFTVKSRIALPLGAEGDFYLGIQRDDRSQNAQNVPLWNNKIDLGLRGQTGWLNWKGGVMMSSEETPFLTTETLPERQPINRYYLEGRTRHWLVRIGDSNPTFSDLSLRGILVRGLNLEFKSNRFNTNFVYGYNKREINESVNIVGSGFRQINTDTYVSIEDPSDTLSTASGYLIAIADQNTGDYNIYEYEYGTPKRDVIGLKMDVSPVRNKYATWKVGFNFFGAEDDSTTLNYRYDPDNQTRYYAYRDSSFFTDYNPKKNWVGTLQTSLRFNDNRSEITAEFGGTIVTENMFSYVSEEIKEDLTEQIDEDIFPINGSTQTSFDKLKLKDDTAKGLSDAIMSVYKFGLLTEVPIPMTTTRFKAEAYRTPTHYVSLGNPQQKTDIGGFKFDLRTRVLRNQLSFRLGYDSYSDNLSHERMQYSNDALDMKDLTKDTSITNFSVSVNPRRWGKYKPSVTLGYRMYNVKNDLDVSINTPENAINDTTSMIDTSTNTIMLSVGGVLPVGLQRHIGMVSISNMAISDNRPLEDYDLNESNNLTVMFNLNSQINPLPVSFTASIGHTSNKSYRKEGILTTGYSRDEITTGITLFNVAGTYKWFRDKRLKTTAGFGYIGSSNDESGFYEIDNSKVSFKIEADYGLTSVSSIGAMLRFINYTDNVSSTNDYTEPIIGINIKSVF